MEVINIRRAPEGWERDPRYVYIGRAGHGLDGYFGNPILKGHRCPICGKIHSTSGSTLKCHEKWLQQRIVDDPVFRQRLMDLHGKVLVCFCKPKPCHGDTLMKYAIRLWDRANLNSD